MKKRADKNVGRAGKFPSVALHGCQDYGLRCAKLNMAVPRLQVSDTTTDIHTRK